MASNLKIKFTVPKIPATFASICLILFAATSIIGFFSKEYLLCVVAIGGALFSYQSIFVSLMTAKYEHLGKEYIFLDCLIQNLYMDKKYGGEENKPKQQTDQDVSEMRAFIETSRIEYQKLVEQHGTYDFPPINTVHTLVTAEQIESMKSKLPDSLKDKVDDAVDLLNRRNEE